MTYQGHAGLGRPVPSPQHRPRPGPPQHGPPPPRKTPQNVDTRVLAGGGAGDAPGAGEQQLIAPKKVRGTPTMYADLQFPSSSNAGDLKRGAGRARALDSERDKFIPKHKTEYGRIVFNPAFAERANL